MESSFCNDDFICEHDGDAYRSAVSECTHKMTADRAMDVDVIANSDNRLRNGKGLMVFCIGDSAKKSFINNAMDERFIIVCALIGVSAGCCSWCFLYHGLNAFDKVVL